MRSLCLVVIAISAHLAIAQTAPLTAPSFAGCYELRVQEWHPARAKNSDFLPRRFQLTTRPATRGRFVARNLDSKVRWDLSLLSSWNVNDDGSLQVIWSTGFVGYEMQLSGSNVVFRGNAHYFTDTDLHPPDSATVVANHVECKDALK